MEVSLVNKSHIIVSVTCLHSWLIQNGWSIIEVSYYLNLSHYSSISICYIYMLLSYAMEHEDFWVYIVNV